MDPTARHRPIPGNSKSGPRELERRIKGKAMKRDSLRRVVQGSLRALLVMALLAGLLVTLTSGSAQQTNAQKALAYVSSTHGIPESNLVLQGEVSRVYSVVGKTLWSAKVYDRRFSPASVFLVAIDSSGQFVDERQVQAEERDAYARKYGVIEPALFDALQTKSEADKVTVGVWIKRVDFSAVDQEMADLYPKYSFRKGPLWHRTRQTSLKTLLKMESRPLKETISDYSLPPP